MRVQYFNPYEWGRSAIINKGSFHYVMTQFHETQFFKILKGKKEGIVYWVRARLIDSYNDHRYNSYDMHRNRRQYLTAWPSIRHPIRCYTSNTRSYAFKNNVKKYKGEILINLPK